MKYDVFQNLIKDTFTPLFPGFKCVPTRELPYFERTVGDVIQYITLYVTSSRPAYALPLIHSYIRFNEVEDILEPLLFRYELIAETDWKKHTTVYDVAHAQKFYNLSDETIIRVSEKHDIESAIPLLNQHLQQVVWPFFERFSSLKAVNNHIESLPINQLAKFIDGDVALKRLVIKRLCHNEDWIAYGNMVLDFFKEHAVKEPRHYKNLDKVTLDLMEVLVNL